MGYQSLTPARSTCCFVLKAWGAAPSARQIIPQSSAAKWLHSHWLIDAILLCAERVVPPDWTLAPPDFASRSGAQDAGRCANKTDYKKGKTMSDLQIYIADLAAYNNGFLHGVWVDATDSIEDIENQIKMLLANSPIENAEEYAIHDYEGFYDYRIGEYDSLQSVHDIAIFIEEYSELGASILQYWCGDISQAQKAMDEDYCGRYQSVADFVEELTKETQEIPENLAFYIDYERMAQDLEANGDIYTMELGFEDVRIFWNR